MNQGPLAEQIASTYSTLSGQLQIAARYVLDHPRDVALLSMREQARRAGVQPATMTRFAQYMGMDGYEDVRRIYAGAIRAGDFGFAGKAGVQALHQKLKGDKALAAEMIKSVGEQLTKLADLETIKRLVGAAGLLASAHHIYCLGLRSSHAIAWHVHYIMSLIGKDSTLLEGIAGVGADPIFRATDEDVLLVVSVLPYTRMTVEMAEYAASRGVPIVAITDSEVAPLAQIAKHTILVPTDNPSFFHSMTPAFVVAEILSALVAGRGSDTVLDHLRKMDEQLAAFNVHLRPRAGKK